MYDHLSFHPPPPGLYISSIKAFFIGLGEKPQLFFITLPPPSSLLSTLLPTNIASMNLVMGWLL